MAERVRRRPRPRLFRDRNDPLEYMDDIELYSRYRFTRGSMYRILHRIGDMLVLEERRGTTSPQLQLLVALRYYATGCFQNVTGDIMGVSRPTAGRTIHRVTNALNTVAREFVRFENTPQNMQEFQQIRGFPNVIGCVDGTQIPIMAPHENPQEFVCRKGFSSINCQFLCNSTLKFIDVCVRFPGSVHDARILRESNLFEAFEEQVAGTENGFILGDSAYPLLKWLLTPFMLPRSESEERYNEAHIATRQAVERAIGVLKRRFTCLKTGLKYTPEKCIQIIKACLVLHNMAISFKEPLLQDVDNPALHEDAAPENPVAEPDENITGQAVRLRIVQNFFS